MRKYSKDNGFDRKDIYLQVDLEIKNVTKYRESKGAIHISEKVVALLADGRQILFPGLHFRLFYHKKLL